MSVFTNIYGIGEKKAEELITKIYNLDDLENKKHDKSNDKQIIGLNITMIFCKESRSEIVRYESIFQKHFPKKGSMEIVGSYRRGAETSGDIDVILTHESNDVFVEFIDKLLKAKVIIEVLSRGPTKCLVIAKLPVQNMLDALISYIVQRKNFLQYCILLVQKILIQLCVNVL